MNRKRPHFVHFGPSVPVVPIGDFSSMSLSAQQWADLWVLCGPSAEQNMRRLQLWQVITSAYLEGLHHGATLTETKYQPENPYE